MSWNISQTRFQKSVIMELSNNEDEYFECNHFESYYDGPNENEGENLTNSDIENMQIIFFF